MAQSVIGSLMTEHRLIDRVVTDIQRRLGSLRPDEPVDTAYMADLVDFICTYADAAHHGKEERILFARLADKPMPDELRATMEQLIREHQMVRDAADRLGEANDRYIRGDGGQFRTIVEALRVLVDVYPRHVETEERRFFKPAIEQFTGEERVAMADEFHEFDRMLLHDKYRGVVAKLEDTPLAEVREPAPVGAR